MPGDQDARAAPHASNGPGLQQPRPRPPRQRPTRLQGCPHGPERITLTARVGAKRGCSRALVPANVVAEFALAFLTFQVAQGCQAGGRAGSDACTAVGRRLVFLICFARRPCVLPRRDIGKKDRAQKTRTRHQQNPRGSRKPCRTSCHQSQAEVQNHQSQAGLQTHQARAEVQRDIPRRRISRSAQACRRMTQSWTTAPGSWAAKSW